MRLFAIDLDEVVGQREHQAPAVIPINFDLNPIVMVVNCGHGSQGSVGYRIGIIIHRDQANAITDVWNLHRGLDSFRLEDLSQQTTLHGVDGSNRMEVFDQQRAGRLWLVRIGDLEHVGQCSKALHGFVVGLPDLLSFVCVHRAEGVAKDPFVGLVVIGGHGWVPCRCCRSWWLLLVLYQVLEQLLVFVELGEFCFRLLGLAKVAVGEVRPTQAAGLVIEHRGCILYGSLGSPEHLFGGLRDPLLGVRNHPLQAIDLFLDRCNRGICCGVVHRRFSMFASGVSFGVTTQFPCFGDNIKPVWKVMSGIPEESFRPPQTRPLGHIRVDVALGSITPCDDKTPTHRKRGALVPNRSGLATKPVPNLPKLESIESRDRIVVAVVTSGDQPISPAFDIRNRGIERWVVLGLDLVRMVAFGIRSLAIGQVGDQMDLSDMHVSSPRGIAAIATPHRHPSWRVRRAQRKRDGAFVPRSRVLWRLR